MSKSSRPFRLIALAGIIALAAAAGSFAARTHTPAPAEAVPLAQASPPDNDNFDRRAYFVPPISPPWSATLPFEGTQDARGATLQEGEGSPCAAISSSVWYGYYAEGGGNVVIDTIGSDYDTALAVYAFDPSDDFLPSPPGGNMRSLACSDNDAGAQSRVQFQAEPFTEYFIQFGAVGDAGTLRINARCEPSCPPRNDNRDYAEYVDVNVYQPSMEWRVDTKGATTEDGEPRSCGNAGATTWYALYAQSDQRVIIDTAGSNFATTLAVYTYGDFSIPSPPGGLSQFACDAGTAGSPARLELSLQRDHQYFVQAGGVDGSGGDLRLRFACDGPCPPYEDNFGVWYSSAANSVELPTNAGATIQPGERTDCGNMDHTTWYGIYTEGPTTLTIDTSGSDFETAIAVYRDPAYTGDGAQLERIACESGGAGRQADLRVPVDAQSPVWVQVGGRNGDSGRLLMNIDCDPSPCPPPFDAQNNPLWISVPGYLPTYDWIDTRGATEEPGEPLSCGNMGGTIWYFIESNSGGRIRFSTQNASFPVAMAVYRVDADYSFSTEDDRIACVDGSTQPAALEFDLVPGERYRVQIGGRNGATGDTEVAVDCVPACPPTNDNSSSPWQVMPPISGMFNTRGATLEAGEPQPCGGARNVGKTVWFSLPMIGLAADADPDATITVTTDGSTFTPIIAAYTTDAFSPPGGANEIACGESRLTFTAESMKSYFIQVGGMDDTGGDLIVNIECSGNCPTYPDGGCQCGGGDGGGRPGGITGPDTGNGGYLGRRR